MIQYHNGTHNLQTTHHLLPNRITVYEQLMYSCVRFSTCLQCYLERSKHYTTSCSLQEQQGSERRSELPWPCVTHVMITDHVRGLRHISYLSQRMGQGKGTLLMTATYLDVAGGLTCPWIRRQITGQDRGSQADFSTAGFGRDISYFAGRGKVKRC
jgi:hypothetical protein